MKPRYEEASSEVYEMLRKALLLEKKIEEAEIKKGEQHLQQSYGTSPDDSRFHIETGGQTYNNFYNTNQALLDSEDVTNKGASSESVNIDSTPMKNTHDTINRLVEG